MAVSRSPDAAHTDGVIQEKQLFDRATQHRNPCAARIAA